MRDQFQVVRRIRTRSQHDVTLVTMSHSPVRRKPFLDRRHRVELLRIVFREHLSADCGRGPLRSSSLDENECHG